ncbi:hypothetical protein WICPIJ_001941 [Wickerhamomyces pijperi]|uniref:Uncharacterized protein n=1 Tax=Wickerhamomyces pijperi TaxID=599730 RepID=A0A9P8QA08_WICPI|nr:hypothetical protein WICPIJ_001941 [Wickerhamomyces pijperi]
MGKSVNHRSNFMEPTVGEGMLVLVTIGGLLELRNELHVCLVDNLEGMLTPGDKIVPQVNVIPNVWQSFSPDGQDSLQFLRFVVQVLSGGGQQRTIDLRSFHEFNILLESVQQWDMGTSESLW